MLSFFVGLELFIQEGEIGMGVYFYLDALDTQVLQVQSQVDSFESNVCFPDWVFHE